jgi:hypothetical protein
MQKSKPSSNTTQEARVEKTYKGRDATIVADLYISSFITCKKSCNMQKRFSLAHCSSLNMFCKQDKEK